MMAATPEQKFNAAVKVIRGLPKNGSFQPSHELMLKFYAYFKQATEGPCTAAKPGIWNIVNRRKCIGDTNIPSMHPATRRGMGSARFNLPKTLSEKIVETMPQTEQVAEFVDTLGAFYELIEEDTKGLTASAKKDIGPNGGLEVQNSISLGEMLKINNNDAKKDDLPDDRHQSSDDSARNARPGPVANGHNSSGDKDEEDDDDDDDDDDNSDEEKEEEEEEEEEEGEEVEEVDEEKRLDKNPRADSGSDTDEFCDTSDQLIQLPSQYQNGQAVFAMGTSTPVGPRRETRVRFAPHVDTADSPVEDAMYRSSALPHSLFSTSPEQMLSDRLALGTAAGLPPFPYNAALMIGRLSESLCVNNSVSSLISLNGNDSMTCEVDILDEEEGTLDADGCDGQSLTGGFDVMRSRGGGEEETASQTAGGAAHSGGRRGASSGARGGRDSGRGPSGGARRGRLPPGSGGQGYRDGGEGHPRGGSLDEQILLALLRMRQDMSDISNRLAALELRVQLQREEESSKRANKSSWWPFPGMSKTLVFLLFIWPVLAPVLINVICQRRRRGPR